MGLDSCFRFCFLYTFSVWVWVLVGVLGECRGGEVLRWDYFRGCGSWFGVVFVLGCRFYVGGGVGRFCGG